jgi:hypothetical protein
MLGNTLETDFLPQRRRGKEIRAKKNKKGGLSIKKYWTAHHRCQRKVRMDWEIELQTCGAGRKSRKRPTLVAGKKSKESRCHMLIFRRIIYVLFFGGFFISMIAAIWSEVSYCANLPTVSDQKTGRICRMVVNHGFVVYGSEREFFVLKAIRNSLLISGLCSLSAAVLGMVSGDFPVKPGRKLNE